MCLKNKLLIKRFFFVCVCVCVCGGGLDYIPGFVPEQARNTQHYKRGTVRILLLQ